MKEMLKRLAGVARIQVDPGLIAASLPVSVPATSDPRTEFPAGGAPRCPGCGLRPTLIHARLRPSLACGTQPRCTRWYGSQLRPDVDPDCFEAHLGAEAGYRGGVAGLL